VATLVPQFEQERKRFGQARLGAFAEAPEVARAAERAASQAHLRLGLLWAVLVVGVVGLGLLVWRLAKTGAAPAPPAA
jgi:formate-dependent nitrite reductase membrane component NrfD